MRDYEKNWPTILLILCVTFASLPTGQAGLRLCGEKGLLLIFLLLMFRNGAAQHEDLNALARAKYVQRFPEYFFVWPVLKQRSTFFVLQSIKDSRQKLTYRPNASFYAGAGTYIFGIGFQFVVAIGALTFLHKITKGIIWMTQTKPFPPACRIHNARTFGPGIQV